MGGAVSGLPHFCTRDRVREQADKMISELSPLFLQEDAAIEIEDIEAAEKSWVLIINDKDILSRFFDTFFRICAEYGDASIAEAHGTGLKTKSKFIVKAFTDCLKLLRVGDPDTTSKAVEKNCRVYLTEYGLRVPQYIIVDEVMMRSFEECENEHWNERARIAWRKIVSYFVKLLIRVGLQVEAELSPEDLANVSGKGFDNEIVRESGRDLQGGSGSTSSNGSGSDSSDNTGN
jgi:hypothetical protein